MKKRIILRVFLAIVAVASIVSVISMIVSNADTDARCAQTEQQIREQQIRNEEKAELLEDGNLEDFYRDIAENSLGYGYSNEKVYVNISGQ